MFGNNIYGNDPLRDVRLNGALTEKKNDRVADFINFMSKFDEIRDEDVYEIKYSSNKSVKGAFRTVSECIFFEVSPDYPDLFFYEEKLKKMYSKKETDDIKFFFIKKTKKTGQMKSIALSLNL